MLYILNWFFTSNSYGQSLSKVMIVFAVLFPSISNAEGTISLNELLQLSYKNNPGVQEKHYEWSAEHSLIASQATLDNPMVGV